MTQQVCQLAGRWYLYIKEENKPFITIQPDKQDLSRLFGAFKSHDPQKIYETKSVLGRKYTELATQHPDLKADFLMPVARKEDLSRIERANIARDSQDNNRFLIFATGMRKSAFKSGCCVSSSVYFLPRTDLVS